MPRLSTGGSNRGSVVSHTRETRLCRVSRFWEKPALTVARKLLRSRMRLEYLRHDRTRYNLPRAPVCGGPRGRPFGYAGDLRRQYRTGLQSLPNVDFSRDILAHNVERLLLLKDSGSGWADLGSPGRVLDVLARIDTQPAWVRPDRRVGGQIHPSRGVL